MKFSVLMSVYRGDKRDYLEKAIESILNQTVKPDEIVIVIDGKLKDEVRELIKDYKLMNPQLFNVLEFKENRGLGKALHDGLNACKYDLVARMDADDIARKDRFEKQLKIMKDNPDIDVVGSYISEFEGDLNNIISIRKVPTVHWDIKKYAKKRNPLNHMTVMFKKESVLKAGNYQDFLWFEDYYLWVRMLLNGYKMYNIPDSLVFARVGKDMYTRRGGFKYLFNDVKLQYNFYKMGFINRIEFISNVILRSIIRVMPNNLRAKVYVKLLRS